jgi:hypothetical protein
MSKNIGSIDRALRLVLGVALLSLLLVLDGPSRWWGLLGLVPLLTGAVSFCPLYAALGINSCPADSRAP